MSIIGLAGKKRSGKTIVGRHLAKKHKYIRTMLAEPFKLALMQMFGWTWEHIEGELKEVVDERYRFSPRTAMQTIGTEWGRSLNRDLWIILADQRVDWSENVVITDIRRENEAKWVRYKGGTIIHIIRPDLPDNDSHKSESGIKIRPNLGDMVLTNNLEPFEIMHSKIDSYVDMINRQQKTYSDLTMVCEQRTYYPLWHPGTINHQRQQ